MANKYHITPDMQLRPCNANIKCPYGDAPHFESKIEGQEYLDSVLFMDNSRGGLSKMKSRAEEYVQHYKVNNWDDLDLTDYELEDLADKLDIRIHYKALYPNYQELTRMPQVQELKDIESAINDPKFKQAVRLYLPKETIYGEVLFPTLNHEQSTLIKDMELDSYIAKKDLTEIDSMRKLPAENSKPKTIEEYNKNLLLKEIRTRKQLRKLGYNGDGVRYAEGLGIINKASIKPEGIYANVKGVIEKVIRVDNGSFLETESGARVSCFDKIFILDETIHNVIYKRHE